MPGRVFSAVFFLANLLFSPSAPSQTQSQTQPIGEASASPEITKIAVGFGPQGIAFTPGAIWVAYGNDTDSGVARIDAATNQVVARVPTGRWPVGAAAGEGAVWIANRDSDTVTRIDPESNRVVANINVGKKPVGVEVGEGSVWVTNMGGATVSIVDPKTNGVTATIHVGTQPSGISISNGAVWVVDAGGPLSHSGSLVRIDPSQCCDHEDQGALVQFCAGAGR